jgi:LytS/YehU family sensor histidine kinase
MVPFSEELETTEEYLAIERVRFGQRLSVVYETSPQVEHIAVPRFLLQPLIENAVRHGIARLPDGGSIAIQTRLESSRMRIDITNDLHAATSRSTENGHGLGLKNVHNRLRTLYGIQGGLTTEVHAGHFIVSLSFPATRISPPRSEI